MIKSYSNHILDKSIWPIILSLSLGLLVNSLTNILNNKILWELSLIISLLSLLLTLYNWLINVVIESTYLGNHTLKVQYGLNIGFMLFLLTEVILFVGVFWSWFHGILSADITLGSEYPPKGLLEVNSIGLPLLNTILLLCSAASVTYSHHLLISGKNRKSILLWLLVTVVLAIIFLSFQWLEYWTSIFSISDSMYGSVFYISTGLHIIHVIFGTIFLIVNIIRLTNYEITNTHHLGYNSSIIYWHLVDVVWLLLWVIVYWY